MDTMTKPRKRSEGLPKRFPSRENTRYVGIPLELYRALEKFAEAKSDQDDRKSVAWAARRAIRKMLTDEGLLPAPGR
jgi:hypothetical protein